TKQFAEEDTYWAELGLVHHTLGLLEYNLGRLPQAEDEYRAALAIDRRLLDRHPDDAKRRLNLAEHWGNLGLGLQMARETAKAEAAYDEAVKLADEVIVQRPDTPEGTSALVGFHGARAQIKAATGRWPEAGTEFRDALDLARTLHGKYPDRTELTQ